MRTTKYYILFLCTLLCTGIFSCSDDSSDGNGGAEVKMYIPIGGQTPLNVNVKVPKDTILQFRVAVDNGSPKNVTATFKVDRTLVEVYNNANGTSFEMVPANAYTFDKDQVILPRYNKISSTANLTLRTTVMEDEAQYLLPVVIDEIKGDDKISKAEQRDVAYIVFSKKDIPPASLMSGNDDPGNPWTVAYVSSERKDGDYGYARFFIDGSNVSYWHHNYGQTPAHVAPFDLVVDLKKEYKIYGVQITARTNPGGSDILQNTGMTSWADVSVAQSLPLPVTGIVESDYKGKTTFRSDVLKWQVVNDAYLSSITRGRYVRLTVQRSWNGGKPDAYNGLCMAEMRIWARSGEEPDF